MHYSPFIKRLLAFVFDLAVINISVMLLGDVLLGATGRAIDPERLQVTLQAIELGGAVDGSFVQSVVRAAMVYSLLSVMVVVLVDAVLPATRWMASPGKKLLGMAVVDASGKRLSFGKSFARHAAKFISALSLFGFLTPLWRANRQALHDSICGTYVVQASTLEAM